MLNGYPQFCAYLQRVTGIVISEDKKYLVESRILPIVRREKLLSLAQLLSQLERGQSPKLAQEVIQAMTINETYFFRDKVPFEVFAEGVLPRICAARAPTDVIRIWSAACSTGQEAYSLSMIIEERQYQLRGRRVEIIGTDLSEPVLEKAREGRYSSFEVERGLTPERIKRHFATTSNGWQLNPNIKDRVKFQPLNLLADYSALGSFDLIMCRNVLIYFDETQKNNVLRRLSKSLRANGFLMVGSSESVVTQKVDLVVDPELRGCYRKGGTNLHGAFSTAPVPTAQQLAAGRMQFPVR